MFARTNSLQDTFMFLERLYNMSGSDESDSTDWIIRDFAASFFISLFSIKFGSEAILDRTLFLVSFIKIY